MRIGFIGLRVGCVRVGIIGEPRFHSDHAYVRKFIKFLNQKRVSYLVKVRWLDDQNFGTESGCWFRSSAGRYGVFKNCDQSKTMTGLIIGKITRVVAPVAMINFLVP